MRRMLSRPVALALVISLPAEAIEQQDHVHLSLKLAVAPSRAMPAGDVLGLYAVEVLACAAPQADLSAQSRVLGWLDRATDVLLSPAWANHRDHFDRPGARIVPTRVRLDRAGSYPLGTVVVPSGMYCQVRLTLTRLPSTTAAPPLASSVRLTRPAGLAEVSTPYPVPVELPLATPWQAGHGVALLTMTLDPAAAAPVLADRSLSEGGLMRQVVARWVAASRVQIGLQP
jgi:hypothetical protein